MLTIIRRLYRDFAHARVKEDRARETAQRGWRAAGDLIRATERLAERLGRSQDLDLAVEIAPGLPGFVAFLESIAP